MLTNLLRRTLSIFFCVALATSIVACSSEDAAEADDLSETSDSAEVATPPESPEGAEEPTLPESSNSSEEEATQNAPRPSNAHETPYAYPAQVRNNFIEACASQPGATEAMCGTCFQVIEQAFTFEEFIELDRAIQDGTATDQDTKELADIIAECA